MEFISCRNESSNQLTQEEVFQTQIDSNGYYERYFEDSKTLWVSANYKNNKLHGERKEYYENGKLKYVDNFDNGFPHGITQYYYENGQLGRELEIIKFFENDTPFINTRKYFDENGVIVEDSSSYYIFLNHKKDYLLNSKDSIKVKSNRLYFNDQYNAITADFDENFNILKNKTRHYPNAANVFSIPVPTEELGERSLKMYINDFSYKDRPDSIPMVRRFLIDYKYNVIK